MSDNVVHAVAGAAGGIVSMALTYPLITISTRSQVNSKSGLEAPSQRQIFAKILKEEGISGLFSGVESALFGIAITQAVYYYWYEFVKEEFEKKLEKGQALSLAQSMLTGAVAGSITSVATNPIWVINTKLLVKDEKGEKKKNSFLEAATQIYKDDGVKGFWRGIVPALALVSNPVIQYTVFEKLKALLEKKVKDLTTFHFFVLGAISKLCATGLTYPYIVVKSRMHVSKEKASSATGQSTTSSFQVFKNIIKNEGVGGLYKGLQSKLLQSVLTSALMFAFKEKFFDLAMALLVLIKVRPAIAK